MAKYTLPGGAVYAPGVCVTFWYVRCAEGGRGGPPKELSARRTRSVRNGYHVVLPPAAAGRTTPSSRRHTATVAGGLPLRRRGYPNSDAHPTCRLARRVLAMCGINGVSSGEVRVMHEVIVAGTDIRFPNIAGAVA